MVNHPTLFITKTSTMFGSRANNIERSIYINHDSDINSQELQINGLITGPYIQCNEGNYYQSNGN